MWRFVDSDSRNSPIEGEPEINRDRQSIQTIEDHVKKHEKLLREPRSVKRICGCRNFIRQVSS
jgi:hypothetical protein